jgi:hypothetical protein
MTEVQIQNLEKRDVDERGVEVDALEEKEFEGVAVLKVCSCSRPLQVGEPESYVTIHL